MEVLIALEVIQDVLIYLEQIQILEREVMKTNFQIQVCGHYTHQINTKLMLGTENKKYFNKLQILVF